MSLNKKEKEELQLRLDELEKEEKNIETTPEKNINSLTRYSQLGLEFLFYSLGGLFGGLYLDRRFDTLPLFILVGSIVGFSLAMVKILSIAKNQSD